jgi:hypothetical protein
VLQCGPHGCLTLYGGEEDIPQILFLMSDKPFHLQYSQYASHGRIARVVWETCLNLCSCCAAQTVDSIQNLALSFAEVDGQIRLHRVIGAINLADCYKVSSMKQAMSILNCKSLMQQLDAWRLPRRTPRLRPYHDVRWLAHRPYGNNGLRCQCSWSVSVATTERTTG